MTDPVRLLRELQIHQLELEVQNRQLIEAHTLLEESRSRYVELYDLAPVGYVTLDRTGAIRQINLAGAGLLKSTRGALIGRLFRLLLARESRRGFDGHLRSWFSDRSRVVTEVHAKNDKCVMELTSGPVYGGVDTSLSCHAVLVDITERKRAEAERASLLAREREARALAEQANRVREDFLAVISHELRTPLAPMMVWLGVLRHAIATDGGSELHRPALEALDASVKAQRDLIEDLVDLARSRNGKQRIARHPIRLASTIQAAVDALMPMACAKRIDLRVAVEDALGPVLADTLRLQQVVANLLSNAIKFTPEDGLVTIRLCQKGNHQLLVVEDNGQGIDPAFLPHVFEPFRQEDSTAIRRHGGLGLGLSIVHELVALHGGTVEAASLGRGRGARFTVSLPAASGGEESPAPAPPRPESDPLPPAPVARPLAGLRLLLVEDERLTREAMTRALEQFGAEVQVADSAQVARAALAGAYPDVLLCDIAMPGEDGNSLVRGLRRQERRRATRVPALALTAHAGDEDRRKALDSGFDLHLAKPVNTEQLIAAVLSLAHRPGSLSG